MIIHYVGDIHQPLHSTAEVNDSYPHGDNGGNYEQLPKIDGTANLHAVWDSNGYTYTGYPNLPLSDDDWNWYTDETHNLAREYSIDKSKLYDGDFN